uniref:Uncharacterized protein n=1 Tax=Panagrolaimus superbus TaxID=310955 RepID=A0A914Y1H3_9BILA
MNLCKIRYCYLKAVESSDYCYKHVKEECLIKETSAPKCTFISEMKLRCDESINVEGGVCDKHANHRKILAEMERDFVSNLDYISKNVFENIIVKQQDDVEHGFEQTKSDIAIRRKEYIKSTETTFSKLAAENFLKVYAADCDDSLNTLSQTEAFMIMINEARKNKIAEETFLRVIAEFTQTRLKQTGYERNYIEKGREILRYYKKLEETEKNKMEISQEDALFVDVSEAVRFMVGIVSEEIPLYDPRIPAEYTVSLEFNRKPCPNITCSKCRKLSIFKGLCLDHSREPIFDEYDNFGHQAIITDETGEPNNPDFSKTSGFLFIHGRSADKEVLPKPPRRNTYSNWSTRSQHGLIANLPSTSDLFIRTAKNARYPLVNSSYHTPVPTVHPAPRMSRMQTPTQPQITFSRTLALGHPPTRMRFDHSGHFSRATVPPTSSLSSVVPTSLTNVPHDPQQQPTYTVIHRYPPQEFNTATIVQTNDPSQSLSAHRARQRLPQPPGYRYNAPPTFRVVRHPTIRIMTAGQQPRIVPSHQPRHP